jgi:hypothetical protein
MEKVKPKEQGKWRRFSEIPVSMYFINLKYYQILLDHPLAIKMVEKLSSSRTMSAASLEMAVPLIPITIRC